MDRIDLSPGNITPRHLSQAMWTFPILEIQIQGKDQGFRSN